MDFSRSANDLFNRMRGFQPWPGAFTTFKTKDAASAPRRTCRSIRASCRPASIAVNGARLLVGCGQGTVLELIEVQIEGKRRMTAQEFINGYRPKTGDRLGE